MYFGLKVSGKIVKKISDLVFPENPGKTALHICYGRNTTMIFYNAIVIVKAISLSKIFRNITTFIIKISQKTI